MNLTECKALVVLVFVGWLANSCWLIVENHDLRIELKSEAEVSHISADTWRKVSVLTCENTYADKSVCEVCG